MLLKIPGVQPYVPTLLTGHSTEFELLGFSGYELNPAGATPIIVVQRPSNVDTAYFLGHVVDQHPLSTQSAVTITTLNGQGTVVAQTLQLQGVTVDSMATGWLYDVIALRYTSMTELYPDGSVTQAITPDTTASVAADLGLASSTDCGNCIGVFHGTANGSSTISGYPDWNDSNGWTMFVSHTSTGTLLQAQTSLLQNATTSAVVKAMAAHTAQTRYDLRVLTSNGQQVPMQFECTGATLGKTRRQGDNTVQLAATVSGCTGTWRLFNAQGMVTQTTTFTSP